MSAREAHFYSQLGQSVRLGGLFIVCFGLVGGVVCDRILLCNPGYSFSLLGLKGCCSATPCFKDIFKALLNYVDLDHSGAGDAESNGDLSETIMLVTGVITVRGPLGNVPQPCAPLLN